MITKLDINNLATNHYYSEQIARILHHKV